MHRTWSAMEEAYLQDKWGACSIGRIAKALGRTEEAVKIRAQKLKCGPHLMGSGDVSLNMLIQTIYAYNSPSSGQYKLEQWMNAGLHVKRHRVQKSVFRTVNIDQFWRWAEQHQNLMNFARFEEDALGREPDWVKRKRARDRENKAYKKTPWTPEEDALLRDLLNQFRYDYFALTQQFGRSESAIKRRIYDLHLRTWPIRNKSRAWAPDEVRELVQLRKEGYSFSAISARLKRSEHSCRGKIDTLQKKHEYHDGAVPDPTHQPPVTGSSKGDNNG